MLEPGLAPTQGLETSANPRGGGRINPLLGKEFLWSPSSA
jgi:hypothetical protein